VRASGGKGTEGSSSQVIGDSSDNDDDDDDDVDARERCELCGLRSEELAVVSGSNCRAL
jgi:hypothetical protein